MIISSDNFNIVYYDCSCLASNCNMTQNFKVPNYTPHHIVIILDDNSEHDARA